MAAPTTSASTLAPMSMDDLRSVVEPTDLAQLDVHSLLDPGVADDARLSIADVTELLGVSAHTLRYYERAGLISVGRDSGGRRVYDGEAVRRLTFITRMRSSDMPIRDIERYVRLVEAGEHTVPTRLAMLEAHCDDIIRRLDDLRWALAVVDYKITTYGGTCGS